MMLRVLLVTSWGKTCGIAAHSEMLIEAVKAADPEIEIVPSAEALDPDVVFRMAPTPAILHLNYHRALHSRWTSDYVRRAHNFWGCQVVITFHDTWGENPPDPLSQDLCALADAFIVHEPCEGLENAIYWRQGVPDVIPVQPLLPSLATRPYLGSVGFDFGWKNYDLLCRLAAEVGWGALLYVPEMSPERERDLRQINPWLIVVRNAATIEVVAGLHRCTATAFLYVNGNSGTSAAIRLGIAARKPVIAFTPKAGGRQFRDLYLGTQGVWWADSVEDVAVWLSTCVCGDWHPGIVALAERDSWRQLGQKYADLYRGLLA